MAGRIIAHLLGLVLFGSVCWLNLTYLDSCVPTPRWGFCSASPVLISTHYSVVSVWNA